MNKEILRRPFPPEIVKQREGQNGKMLSYLEEGKQFGKIVLKP